MKIIITNQMLSIAPFISTHWSHVETMHVRNNALLITLSSGEVIEVPRMTPEIIEKIFTAHAFYLERKQGETKEAPKKKPPQTEDDLVNELNELSREMSKVLKGELWKGMNSLLQHDPQQANSPDLPTDALKKMSEFAQMTLPDETAALPEAEPHCNCFHCQILRALHGQAAHADARSAADDDEPVSDKDLEFSQWEITQTGDKLFKVTNRLDSDESYNVYLGDPVGCTCGKRGCEHVLAVLKT